MNYVFFRITFSKFLSILKIKNQLNTIFLFTLIHFDIIGIFHSKPNTLVSSFIKKLRHNHQNHIIKKSLCNNDNDYCLTHPANPKTTLSHPRSHRHIPFFPLLPILQNLQKSTSISLFPQKFTLIQSQH